MPSWLQQRGPAGVPQARVPRIGQTAVRVEMPEDGKNKPAFQNHHKQLSAPFNIYADFEALTTKVEGSELDPMKNNTRKTQHHEACSYCYVVFRCDGQTEPPVEYRRPNTAEHFLKALRRRSAKSKLCRLTPNNADDTRGSADS